MRQLGCGRILSEVIAGLVPDPFGPEPIPKKIV
jgi:hypothetical protein